MRLKDKLTIGAIAVLGFAGFVGLYNSSKRDEQHYNDVRRDFAKYFGNDIGSALRVIGVSDGKAITHYQMEKANERVMRARSIIENSDMNRVYAVLGKPVGSELTREDECVAVDRLSRLNATNSASFR